MCRLNVVYHSSLTSKLPLFNFFVPTGRWQELYSPLRATLTRTLPSYPPSIFPSIFSWFAPLPLFSPQDWLPLVLQDIQWVEVRAGVCSTGKCGHWAGYCGFLEQVLRHLTGCLSKLKVTGRRRWVKPIHLKYSAGAAVFMTAVHKPTPTLALLTLYIWVWRIPHVNTLGRVTEV